MKEIYRQLWELAHPYLQTRNNEEHTKGSYEFACILVQEEQGEEDIVLPAIILHDLGWWKVPEDLQLTAFGPGDFDEDLRRVHEIEGAKMARAILLQVGYPDEKIAEITTIIEGHDSRLDSLSLNDQLVKPQYADSPVLQNRDITHKKRTASPYASSSIGIFLP